MPTPQRLPIVNSDDGVWGDILRQYLLKEHYDDGTDNVVNGGHKTITVRAGTATAGTAPLKFTSGTLLTAPEAGAIEFNTDKLYFTKSTGPTRQTVATYDTTGSTGDIYYRDSSSNFTRLAAGNTGDFLTVSGGIPAWTPTISNASTITVKDTNFTIQDNVDTSKQLQFELSGITTATTRTLTVPDATTTLVGTDITQTLTNKTLTTPKIDTVYDTSNNLPVIQVTGVASAVNYSSFYNSATGNPVGFYASGSDTDIGISLKSKGVGSIQLRTGASALIATFTGVASSVNYFAFTGSATGVTPSIAAAGTDTNINLNITSKGTGSVLANNVPVVTTTGTQTLTNKTLSGASNTFSSIPQSAITSLTTDLGNKADVITYGTTKMLTHSTNNRALSLNLNPESGTPTFMPNFFNDLAYLVERGGSYTVTVNGGAGSWDLTNAFLPDTSFAIKAIAATTDIFVITITLPASLTQRYSTYAGIVFPHGWNAKDVTIEYQKNSVWTQFYSVTNNTDPVHFGSISGDATTITGLRYTLTNTNQPVGQTIRISSLFCYDYSSKYLGLGYLMRNGGAVYGTNATPFALTATGGDTDISINLVPKGAGTLNQNGVPVVTTTATQTLTNKTLTNPKIGVINDTNGNTGAWIGGTASAVNFLQMGNATTGTKPLLRAQGADTNVGLSIAPKGTGTVVLLDGNFSFVVEAAGVTSAVNYLLAGNAATGNAPYLQGWGSDTNVNLNLRTRGSGVVQANGVDVVTTTGTQTLTNKTLDNSSTITAKAANLTIQDGTDTTKQAKFDASGITTATTRTYTLPDASGTILLSTNATFNDNAFTLQDDLDNTKKVQFQLSGLTTATTRTLTVPDVSGTIYVTGGTDVSLVDGGTNASLTASNGGIVYSTASAMAILAGTATAGQMLRSGANGAPSWSTATFPAATSANQILYSSAANTITGLTSANTAALVTNSTGAPSFTVGTTANRVLRTDGTTISFAQVALGTDVTGTLPVANGGTNSTATPTNGGVSYGTGTAYAFTAAGASGQFLKSNAAAAPTWTTLQMTDIPDAAFKKSVLVATTATLTASFASNVLTNTGTLATLVIDGVTLVVNDRVLVKDQTSALQNGIYYVSDPGSASTSWTLTRATDSDTSSKIGSGIVAVDTGAANGGKAYTTSFKVSDTLNTNNMLWYELIDSGTTQTLTNKTISGASNTLANIANSSLTNSSVTVNGTAISLGASGTITANTTNSLTFNNGGAGVVSGSTFNGGSAVTVSYNTIGASPLAGSSSLTTTGTVTSGTWSGSFGAVSGANLTNLTAGNLTGTIPSAVLGNSSLFVGTTSVALNRASANLALTGISSVTLPGATSGTVLLQPTATAGTTTITLPATTGTVVTTGDTGTVTNTMLAGSIALSKLAAAAYNTAPAASTLAEWDANKNLSANAFIPGFRTQATAGGTTTLTIADAQTQEFTGTLTQTVILPTTSVAAGAQYTIINSSTGAVTVQSSGLNTIATLAASSIATFIALIATPTTAANWDTTYNADGDVTSNTTTSVDSEVALFSGTNGKVIKRATGTGLAKLTSGVLSIAASGTDYAPATSGTSILKGSGSGGFSSAVAGTDYAAPNQTMFIGTTSVAINRASANLALTGISSVTLPGATSGTVLLQPTATAGTTTITLPATTGTVVTTGDTGTVTNTMLAGSIALSKLAAAAYSTTPTANTLAQWDANKNLLSNAFIPGFTTTATAAGTTTLTIASTQIQEFTGTTTQTVVLPTTSVVAGGQYTIVNNSTGAVTVQSSGLNTIATLAANTTATFTAMVATPTTAANWDSNYVAGGGDASTNTTTSVVDEVALFADTTGKTIKRATTTGIAKLTSGVLSAAVSGTDYALPNQTMFIGTTSVAINRASANLALTGISSVTLPGATSGTVLLQPTATAGTTTITLPATTGTVITTGDTGTVTSTMILDGTILNADINASAGIVDTKLATISTAGKVSNSATTATSANTANAIVARDASGNFSAGTITATTFSGALSGNATTATTATNLAGGSAGTLPYQSAAGTTAMLTAGTSGQFLRSNAAAAPAWTTLQMTDIPDAVFKKSVKAATTADLGAVTYANGTAGVGATITGGLVVFPAQDGITLALNDRLLVKDQATPAQNGIYTLTTVGVAGTTAWVLTRATDADTNTEIGTGIVGVDQGTASGGKLYTTNFMATDTIGTTAMSWYAIVNSGMAQTLVNKTISGSSNTLSNIALSSLAAAAYSTTPTASTLAQWDSNLNLSANGFQPSTAAIQSANGVLVTLTMASPQMQVFTTGSSNTFVRLPNVNPAGATFWIINKSSGSIYVNNFDGSLYITNVVSGGSAMCVATAANTSSWVSVNGGLSLYGGGASLLSTIDASKITVGVTGAGAATMTFPAATDTVATLAATQTLTNKTISGASNTLTSIANSSLTNSSITIAGTATSLGGAITQDTITGLSTTGLVKRTGANTLAIAVSGTDYALPSQTMYIGTTAVTINRASAALTLTGVSLSTLTIGTGLSGTSYNGSAAVTVAIDATVATLTGTQTLTNKTLSDATTYFQDDVDTTKKAQFDLSGISTATTRTYTMPNASTSIPGKYTTLIGNGSSTAITVTHSLNTQDIIWSIRDASTNEFVDCDVVATSTTTATFTFATAPALNAYKVVIVG